MKIVVLFAAAAAVSVVWHVVTDLRLYTFLRKRGESVSFLWLRALAPRYAFLYKRLTEAEKGRPGPLFYHWIVSINLVLVFVVAVFIVAGLKGLNR